MLLQAERSWVPEFGVLLVCSGGRPIWGVPPSHPSHWGPCV